MKSRGITYVISAPSGAGKTSLVNALVNSMPDLLVSVSYTTRPKRPAEVEGVNYHFLSTPEFEKLIQQQAYIEYANVFGHYYGTSKDWLEAKLEAGFDVILEIDWQGARQVRQRLSESISIFILPPSREELRGRLQRRGQDNEQVIETRMVEAKNEISHYHEYDYLVINDVFEKALNDLQAIVRSQRLLLSRQQVEQAGLLKNVVT